MTNEQYELQRKALQEEAYLWGGWEHPGEPWMASKIGWATHMVVPAGWARVCVAELLGLPWLGSFKELPAGPAQALINLLFPHEIINGITVITGEPPSPLGKTMMLEAHSRCYRQAALQVE